MAGSAMTIVVTPAAIQTATAGGADQRHGDDRYTLYHSVWTGERHRSGDCPDHP